MLIRASPTVSIGCEAARVPACSAFCSRNSAPTPAIAVPYSCHVSKKATGPWSSAATASFRNAAVSAYPHAAARPSRAARGSPVTRSAETISTASKQPVAIRARIQVPIGAWSTPPLGWAAASPVPRLTVTSATAPQVRGASRRCHTQLLSRSVSGSSTMKIGCTRAIGPVARAPACSSAATMTIPIPASQTRRWIRSPISPSPSGRDERACEAARRCSTAAVALLAEVRRASTTEITTLFLPPGGQTLPGGVGPVPAAGRPGAAQRRAMTGPAS